MDVSAEEKKADNSTRISMVTACIGTLESKLYSLLFLCIKKNIHDSGLKCKEKAFELLLFLVTFREVFFVNKVHRKPEN